MVDIAQECGLIGSSKAHSTTNLPQKHKSCVDTWLRMELEPGIFGLYGPKTLKISRISHSNLNKTARRI